MPAVQLKSAGVTQGQIDQNQIGLFGRDHAHGAIRILRMPADAEIGLGVDQHRKAHPHHRVIVDDHDPPV